MSGNAWKRTTALAFVSSLGAAAMAQVPDLVNAFEMGGRAMGMGGALYSNASDASASYWNPAGLGYISKGVVELNFRNRPSTDTALTGDYPNPTRSGSGNYGDSSITFGGIGYPLKKGVLGLSYAIGGYSREEAFGRNLTSGEEGNDTVADPQQEFLKVVTEYITVAYGVPMNAGMNFGVGLVFAKQNISNAFFQRILDQENGVEIGRTETNLSESGHGFGGIVGLQFSPPGRDNISFGISYRTPITLNGLEDGEQFAKEIPARLQGGIAFRQDGLRGGKDYLVGGIDVAYFFSGNNGKILQRDAQVSAGLGFEYNWSQSFGFLPIRFGFRTTDGAGDGFGSRDAFTMGLGYRPKMGDYTIDLSLASASGQSRPDVAISMTFKLGG
ncbi:MAG: hypothetical protein U0R49_03305 [Fimbriimonadales bacterium]